VTPGPRNAAMGAALVWAMPLWPNWIPMKAALCHHLGGRGEDTGWGVGVDSLGNAYVSGYTDSADFPTTQGAFQTRIAGARSCFVTKVDASRG